MIGQILIFATLTAAAAAAGYLLLAWLPHRGIPVRVAGILSYTCRILLAVVFLLAAYEKASDPYGFASSIFAYRVVPAHVATITGVLMPIVEIAAALALIIGLLWRGGAIILGGMLLVFIAALFQAILRGIDIDCGCFGQESSPVSFRLIARNYGLLLAALFPLVMDWRRTHRNQPTEPTVLTRGRR